MMRSLLTPDVVRRENVYYPSRKLVFLLVEQYPFVNEYYELAPGHNYELNEYGLHVLRSLAMQHGAVHASSEEINAVLKSNMTEEAELIVTGNRARIEETIKDSRIIDLFKKKASTIIDSSEGMTDKHLTKLVYHGRDMIEFTLEQMNARLQAWTLKSVELQGLAELHASDNIDENLANFSNEEKAETIEHLVIANDKIEILTALIHEYDRFIALFGCMPHIVHVDMASDFDDVVKMIAMIGQGNCWNLLVNTGRAGQSLLTLNFQGGCIWVAEAILLGMHEIQFIMNDRDGIIQPVGNPMLIIHDAAAPFVDGEREVIQIKYSGCAKLADGQVDAGMHRAVTLAGSDAFCLAAKAKAIKSLEKNINNLTSLLTTEPVFGVKYWILRRMIINESSVFSTPEPLDTGRDELILALGGTFLRERPLSVCYRKLTIINLSYVTLTNIRITGDISRLQFVVLRCPNSNYTFLVNIGKEILLHCGRSTSRDVYDFYDLGNLPPRRQELAAPKPDLPESELVDYYLNQKDEQGLIFSRFALYNGATFKIGQTFLKFTVPNTSI
jgi:hypothetical protein